VVVIEPYYCDAPKDPPGIWRLTVYELSGPDPGGKVRRCAVEASGKSRHVPTPWRYGSEPPESRLTECAPLQRGRSYLVEMLGAGAGTQEFSVAADGRPELAPGRCGKGRSP
jgi:hypothetical protein